MKRVAHYDGAIVVKASNPRIARILTTYFPFFLLLVVIPVTTFLLATRQPDGVESAAQGSDGPAAAVFLTANKNVKVQWVGFTWMVGFLTALSLAWTGHYYVSQAGRLTYDRVSHVVYNYVPWTPKGVGIIVMLVADVFYVPVLLFSHRQLVPGSVIERLANYLLLQNPSAGVGLGSTNGGPGGEDAAFTFYPTVFWLIFLIAVLVFWVGLCCLVPVLAYPTSSGSVGGGTPGSGLGRLLGRFTSNKAVIIMTLGSILGPMVLHTFIRAFPCETATHNSTGSTVTSVMMSWHTVECHSTPHVTYMVLCSLALFTVGLPMFSAIQQFQNLDSNSFDAMDVHAVRVDPVPLSLITFSRGLLVICVGLSLDSRVIIAMWMLTQLAAFVSVIFIRFSSCVILNQMARLSTGIGAWTSLCVALLLLVNTYHWEKQQTSPSSSSNDHNVSQGLQEAVAVDDSLLSVLVETVFFLGYFGLIIAAVVWHTCKRRFQFFESNLSEDSVLQDLSSNVFF